MAPDRSALRLKAAVFAPELGKTLIGEHGEILLGDHVTEERAENSDVEASSITGTDPRLWVYLVGYADTRF